jgi:mono/diheme cytochrome c family protein
MGLFDSEEEKKVYNIEYKKMKEDGYPFHPFATWKDVTVGFLILLILVFLSATKGVHMDPPADPTSQYLPRPEWYFMFLFQLLKYFPGWTAIFAVAIIPGIVSVLLLLVPFYDRNPYRHPKRRPVAVAAMTLGMASIIGLTVLAYWEDAQAAKAGGHGTAATTTHAVPAAGGHTGGDAAGKAVFEANCVMCHGATGTQIPNVALFDKAFIEKRDVVNIVTNGTPKGMPPFKGRLTDEQIKAVATYLKTSAK